MRILSSINQNPVMLSNRRAAILLTCACVGFFDVAEAAAGSDATPTVAAPVNVNANTNAKDAKTTQMINDLSDVICHTKNNELGYGAHALTDTDMSGLYVGIGGGGVNTNVEYSVTENNPYPGAIGTSVFGINSNAGKFTGTFASMIGYGKQIQRFYISAELYAGYDPSNLNVFSATNAGYEKALWSASVKRGFYCGFVPRIGYKLSPALLAYIGLGVEVGKWEAKVTPSPLLQDSLNATNGAGDTVTQAMINDSLPTKTMSKNAIIFAPRIGLEVYLTRNIFMRGEFTYIFDPKITFLLNTVANVNVNSPNVTQKFSITQQRFLISVGYKF